MKQAVPIIIMLCLLAMIGRAEAKDLIFSQGYNSIEVIDTDTDETVAKIPIQGFVREMVWTEDNKTMYVTTQRHNIVKIDIQQMKVVKTIDANQDGWKRMIWGIVLDNDKKSAYINSVDRKVDGGDTEVRQTISQIDLETGNVLRSMTAPWGVASLAYQKDGKTLFAIGQNIHKIDLTRGEMKIFDSYPLFDKHKEMLPIWPFIRENGGVFLANYYNPEFMGLVSIDTNTGEIAERRIQGPPVLAYCFIYSPDRKKAYGIMDEIHVIDLATNTVVKSIPNAEGTSFSVIPSSDGKKLYAGAGGATITVYDAQTYQVLKVLQMSSDAVALSRVTL